MAIPAVNIAAVLHLACVSALLGVIATETVMELMPLREKDLHHGAIRFHLWIDLLLELPLALAVVATGIALATLIKQLTMFHVVKISLAALALLLGLSCILRVVRRNRLRRSGVPEEALEKETRKIHLTAAVIYVLLTVVLCLGAWIAYNRVLLFYS